MKDVLSVTLGDMQSGLVRSSMTLLAMVDPDLLRKAIKDLDYQESIMPLLDPSKWQDGTRFQNTDDWKRFFEKLLPLVEIAKKIHGTNTSNV